MPSPARTVAADALDLSEFIRPGDRIIWGQGGAEPLTLIEALIAQRSRLGGVRAFLTISFATLLQPEHADHIAFEGLGGLGTNARLARHGLIDVYPTHFGAFCKEIRSGAFPIDVFMVQLSGPDAQGQYSFGTDHGYALDAVRRARVVIAEVNAQMPFIAGEATIGADEIDVIVHSDRPLMEMPLATPDAVDHAIARNVVGYVEDGATFQIGVGGVPSAILEGLRGHRDLGVHSGMISDAVLELMEAGVVTNARKRIDTGWSVACALYGSQDFYRRAAAAPIRVVANPYISDMATMAQIDRLIAINSAIQVDLTGQGNAEFAAGRYVGAPGGQVDFVRGARLSPGGRSITAIRSRAAGGQPRIVASLGDAPVTLARTDIDVVATEYGVAELAGKTIRQRIAALTAIAHPDDREALERAGHTINGQGRSA